MWAAFSCFRSVRMHRIAKMQQPALVQSFDKSRKIPVHLSTMKYANEFNKILFNCNSDPVVAYPDPIIATRSAYLFDVFYLFKSLHSLNVLDELTDLRKELFPLIRLRSRSKLFRNTVLNLGPPADPRSYHAPQIRCFVLHESLRPE